MGETRVAVMAIIVEKMESAERLNALLHEYGKYIIGRMGLPYRVKNISIVSVAMDAPPDTISSLRRRFIWRPERASSFRPASAQRWRRIGC